MRTTQVICCSLAAINMLGFPFKRSIYRSANDCFGASALTLVSYVINWGCNPFWSNTIGVLRNLCNLIRARCSIHADVQCKQALSHHGHQLLEFFCKRSVCTSHVNCTLCSVCTWYIVYHETAFVLPDSVTIVTCLWPSVGRFVSRRCSFSAGHRCLGFLFTDWFTIVSSVKDVQMTGTRRHRLSL